MSKNGQRAPWSDGIVGLIALSDSFYAFGDEEHSPITVNPCGAPTILQSIPMILPYDIFAVGLKHLKERPRSSNAFVVGRTLSVEQSPLRCHAAVQFYRLTDDHWRMAMQLKPRNAPLLNYLAECHAAEG